MASVKQHYRVRRFQVEGQVNGVVCRSGESKLWELVQQIKLFGHWRLLGVVMPLQSRVLVRRCVSRWLVHRLVQQGLDTRLAVVAVDGATVVGHILVIDGVEQTARAA